jgi:hypothetical protein
VAALGLGRDDLVLFIGIDHRRGDDAYVDVHAAPALILADDNGIWWGEFLE